MPAVKFLRNSGNEENLRQLGVDEAAIKVALGKRENQIVANLSDEEVMLLRRSGLVELVREQQK